MTPLPRPLKALGVAGVAASLMLAPLPAHAEGNDLYRNPSKFYTGAVSDCLLDKQYGRGQIADIWAYCNGLISTNVYEIPNSSASRMDVIAALYRLAGYPEVKNLPEVSPYADVETYDPTYPLAIWASREGITSGWSDGKFHPNDYATTSTVIAFLYRAAGSPQKLWYRTWEHYNYAAKDITPIGKPFWKETSWYTVAIAPYPKVPVNENEPDNLKTAKPTTILDRRTVYSMIRDFHTSGYQVVGTHK